MSSAPPLSKDTTLLVVICISQHVLMVYFVGRGAMGVGRGSRSSGRLNKRGNGKEMGVRKEMREGATGEEPRPVAPARGMNSEWETSVVRA